MNDPEFEVKCTQLMDITGMQFEAAKNLLELFDGNLEVKYKLTKDGH